MAKKSLPPVNKSRYTRYWIALVVLIVCGLGYALYINSGWVETKDSVYKAYSLKHPKGWIADKFGDSQWQVREPGPDNNPGFQAVITNTTPLNNEETKDAASGYSAIWIAKLGPDGSVKKLTKNPLCDKDGEVLNVEQGYYRCVSGNDSQKVIGVAIDVGDYAKKNSYNIIGGHKYGAAGIECTQGSSTKYKLEDTCEKIAKSFRQLIDY